ncbi:hypothetical protein HWV23_10885 [Natronomonas halophila]|uniref:hypothetical protein n=1 Tax=Natronomonas halophila TaxID=2747817 RepID=UPI0015B681E1|nr:hypothetical protein [Natronomonas halophila]QLD86205.1 hypothetical protein HWV23_10885 [Natronomonas halophila]
MNETPHREPVVPRFESLIGQSGVHIRDPVEDVQALLYTDRSVDPTPAPTEGFVYPVDSATEVTVSRLRTPFLINLWIRDLEGNTVEEFDPNSSESTAVTTDDYLLELAGMGMKIYARIDNASIEVTQKNDTIEMAFGDLTAVRLGARSLHSQPARTLTTTSEPTGLMRAMSLFGNAMKTWSPERTWPSLRGHPPLLELGDECAIPEELTPPDTGIRLTVPADLEWLYPAAPLAYWLGATVDPGSPALQVGNKRYPLGMAGGYDADSKREAFEDHVRDVLQFTFLFDCAVRTEGFYDVELDARRRVEGAEIPLDFEQLYDAPLTERVQTYLDLDDSFETLAGRVGRPGWRLTADVEADPDRASIMPFLARDLAVVRCPSDEVIAQSTESASMENVFSAGTSRGTPDLGNGTLTRSSSTPDSGAEKTDRERVIDLPDADSMAQAWVGEGFAVGAAKASTTSYLQRLEKHAEGNSRISIDVVVNDDEMTDEADVSEIYGERDHLDFDIDVHQSLSKSELAGVLEQETDFIHYIGHVEPEGFNCSDGYLDANQLGNVGADTFVLNACASYEQGQRLVDHGAIAGVVTLEDVISSVATKIGKNVARLLNYGFPIESATGLIQETMFTGLSYAVVGDSNATLAQSKVPIPNVVRVGLRGDGRFDVRVETFASWNYDVGSMYRPYIEGCDCHYVVPGELDAFIVDDADLNDFLNISTFPVVGADNLYWSDKVSASTLRERLQSYA